MVKGFVISCIVFVSVIFFKELSNVDLVIDFKVFYIWGNFFNDINIFVIQDMFWYLIKVIMGNVEVSVVNIIVFNFYKCFFSFKWMEYFFFNSNISVFWIYNNSFYSYFF